MSWTLDKESMLSWLEEAHAEALTIIRAIGLDPDNIPVGGIHVDGDAITVREWVRDEDGNKILDGEEFRERTRVYRLHPVEPIDEPA